MQTISHRIFLVEDHPVMRAGLEQFIGMQPGLELCGSAGSAEEALEILPCGADLVLVDISLPRMNGLDFIRIARTRWPELPCIILSGHLAERYAEPARDAGAFDYVMKGNAESLVRAITRALAADAAMPAFGPGGES